MEFRDLTWRNRIAWLVLAAILMTGCVSDFELFALSCAGVPPEELDSGTLLLLILIYAFAGGSGYTPGGAFAAQDVQHQPGFAVVRLGPDGSVLGMQPFTADVRGTDAVLHPLADPAARIAGSDALLSRRIYFSDTDNDSVKVFDPAANEVIASIRVGNEPHGLAISPDGSRLYVGNRRGGTVSVVDTEALQALAPIALPAGTEPGGVAITPDGEKVYVVNEAGNGSVYSVDLGGARPPVQINTGVGARDVAISPDGSLAYVTNQTAGSVVVVDTLTDSVVTSLLAPEPTGVVFSPNGNRVYVAGGGQIGRVFEFEVGGEPAPLREWLVGANPEGLAISPTGGLLVAANRESEFASVIRLKSEDGPLEIELRKGFGAGVLLQPAP